MLGSLYGDLPEAKDSGKPSASSASNADGKKPSGWAAQQLRAAKRTSSLAPPPSILRTGRGRGSQPARPDGVDAGRGGAGPGRGAGSVHAAEPAAASFLSSNGAPLRDEYDPARPNDYAATRAARETARKAAAEEADRQEAMRRAELVLQAARPGETREPENGNGGLGLGAAVPGGGGPSPHVAAASGEEAFLRRGGLGQGGAAMPMAEQDPRGMDLAAKMMAKMGWRGGGLGREQQGMATPLIAQKSSARSGTIVQGEDTRQKPQGVSIQGRPTKVVLLRNMVGPGQVDADLEDEVGMECSTKYGAVSGVLIYEVTELNFPPELAVRIFVSFERQESAIKAAVDLGGRFFGGRQVRATFYSEDRFAANDLAPDPAKDD